MTRAIYLWSCVGLLLASVTIHCDTATSPCFSSCVCDIDTLPTSTNSLRVLCSSGTLSDADPGLLVTQFSNITSLELTGVPWLPSIFSVFCDIVGLETLIITSSLTSSPNTSLFQCFPTLIYLELSNNSIETLNYNSFSHLHDIKFLNLSSNKLESLDGGVFAEDLSGVEVLDLSHNFLTAVKQDWLRPFTSLQQLNLTDNRLETLSSTDLNLLKNLSELDVSHNILHNLSGRLTLPHLLRLDLSANQIEQIEVGMFQGLISLQVLDLQANKITSAHFSHLSSLPRPLINLQLSHNDISMLPLATLDKLTLSVNVNLSHNCISEIGEFSANNSFHTDPDWGVAKLRGNQSKSSIRVQTLDLSYNYLSSLSHQLLQHTALSGLRHLNLSHNNISQLPRYGIETLEQLETVDLSYNHITWLDVGTFKNPNLRSINLSHNLLVKVISMSFLYVPLIQHIDLSHNTINYLYRYVFYKTCGTVDAIHISVNLDYNHLETDVLWKLLSTFRPLEDTFCTVSVSLRHNRLTHLLGEALESYQKHTSLYDYAFFRAWEKVEFDIRDNPLICDCVLYDDADALIDMRHTFDFNATLLRNADFWQDVPCSSPIKLTNETALSSMTKISCVITDYCPSSCDCTYYPVRQVTTVNCSDRGLIEFPAVLPMGTKEILLQRNKLRLLSENISSLYDVSYIDLSENFISYIDYDVWLKLIEVPVVLLHNNKLRSMPKNIMLGKRLLVKNMTLSGNDFRCICDNLWLREWLINHTNIIHGEDEILCTNSVHFGRVLVLLDDVAFNCPKMPNEVKLESEVRLSVSAIIAMAVCPVLLLLIVVLIYLVRWKGGQRVHAVRTWRPRQLDDNDLIYDVYISYCKGDSNWVHKELENRLISQEPPYHVYLQHESSSSLLTEYLLDGMDKCETIIMVMSANLLSTDWSSEDRQTRQQLIHNSAVRTIVILLDLDPPTDLDLRDVTCIHSQDPLFWDKLFHLLPNPQPKTGTSHKLAGSLHFDLASQHHKKY